MHGDLFVWEIIPKDRIEVIHNLQPSHYATQMFLIMIQKAKPLPIATLTRKGEIVCDIKYLSNCPMTNQTSKDARCSL